MLGSSVEKRVNWFFTIEMRKKLSNREIVI